MAELFVPKVIDELSDVVMKQLEHGVKLVMGVEEEVGSLSDKLKTVGRVLHDAERRRLTDSSVCIWLEKLEDITYEMEDVLDEWSLKIVKPNQLGAPRKTTFLKKVCSVIPSLCYCLKQIPVRSDIALKIKEINNKLELTLKEANQFNFLPAGADHSRRNVDSNAIDQRRMTISSIDESKVQGRDFDKESLLDHLLLPENKTSSSSTEVVEKDKVKVVSIVGVGGSGKTTLAQFLYNDDRVKEHFEVRKWVCVSDPFDPKRIAKALLENPETSNVNNVSELESLFQLIKNSFSGKRFLLVFDDVWTEKSSEWEPFSDSLKDVAPGSIILVTTRSEKVARVVGSHYLHKITLLETSACWLIIKQMALSRRSDLCERVEKIGQRIAEKCKGLPLAAKILGGLLQFKDTLKEWQQVLDSEIWEMKEAASELFPHFYLSYKELSPQQKWCFSYCAVFPKDADIDVEQLIRLWKAQGYLGRSNERDDDKMEKEGYECFKILAMRSFFQELLGNDPIWSCKMHDIVHDFAQFIGKSEICVFEEELDCQKIEIEREKIRHLTMQVGKSINSFIIPDGLGKVRSLFVSCHGKFSQVNLLSNLKCVRSLTLSRCGLQELPQEMGNLIHMRYLDVSENNFKELPETICNLYFLESLDINSCFYLKHYPEKIGELVHLKYLINYQNDEVKKMPYGIEKLTYLRELTEFVPSANYNGASFNHLAKLKYLKDWNIVFRENHDFVDESSMEMLKPLPRLQTLVFWDYPITQLPKWIGDESLFNNLKSFTLWRAPLILSLPALGKLSSLQFLYFYNLSELNQIDSEFCGVSYFYTQRQGHHKDEVVQFVAFPNLKTLHFEDLPNWERWEDISDETTKDGSISVFPSLERLEIEYCGKLEALPHHILGNASSLKALILRGCEKLAELYSNKAGEDWKSISHIPQITIE